MSTSGCKAVPMFRMLIGGEAHIVKEKDLCFRTIRGSGNAYLFCSSISIYQYRFSVVNPICNNKASKMSMCAVVFNCALLPNYCLAHSNKNVFIVTIQ